MRRRSSEWTISFSGRPETISQNTQSIRNGDDGGPRFHPCRRVQEALRGAGIDHQKVIAGHGSPLPFLRRGTRDQLFEATGTRKLPTLELPDGRIISHSRAILAWVHEQSEQGEATKQAA
jgi:glutathione S-transferase